ncbi:NADPH oxidase 5-like [Limulus polyphemus]|uniref:NADPH oxidase 5-like n=1 Tax=Limulus polyphemus TaxID=6850 RepID=A0ABM1RWJ4_LIMPO|nr:NADPH oxidase 5-like [Limulus polyphemus]
MELIAKLSRTESQRGFSPKYLVYFEEMFRRHAGEQKELNLDQFKKIIQSKNTFFSERVFQLYDTDNLGSISLEKFLQGIKKFAIQKPEEKLKSIFDIYDIDGDGFLQPSELDMVVKECMQENGLTFTDVQLQDLVMTLFEEADVDKSGVISFEKFRAQLNRHPGLIENLSISAEKQLLPPSQENVTGRFQDYLPSKLRWRYIRNNYISAVFLFIYLAINLILFVSRSLQVSKMKDTSLNILAKFEYLNNLTHRERKYNITEEAMLEDYPRKFTFEVLARASGQCLNFTCMFIVLPVLRRSLTFLRERGFSDYLPLDQGVYFHKLTGWFILFYSVLHTIMHICNFTRISNGNRHLAAWLLFSTETGIGWVKGSACITGWILLVILITMVICALNCIRRRGMFEIFYYTHLLYLAFWIILLLHGPNFWKWFLGPALLFLVETLMKIQMSFSKRGKTCVIKGILLPSKVIHLIIKRPRHFEFQPGDYVFIKIPSITQFEWHPFTISSAPEQEDVLWLHIRTVGEWTSQLWNYFDKPFFLNQKKMIITPVSFVISSFLTLTKTVLMM